MNKSVNTDYEKVELSFDVWCSPVEFARRGVEAFRSECRERVERIAEFMDASSFEIRPLVFIPDNLADVRVQMCFEFHPGKSTVEYTDAELKACIADNRAYLEEAGFDDFEAVCLEIMINERVVEAYMDRASEEFEKESSSWLTFGQELTVSYEGGIITDALAELRTMPISDRVAEAISNQREAFSKKSGREPGPDDPVFFDPDASTPVPMDEDQLRADTLEVLREAEIPPQFIYAYAKTGFLVGQEGYENMPPEQRAEYDAAITEYFVMEDEQASRESH